MNTVYISKCRFEFRNKKKFRYGKPAYNVPFRAVMATTSEILTIAMFVLHTSMTQN
jgi:hypothetical protein